MNAPAAARASRTTWLAVLGSSLGAFMAVLDIQIVNASLGDIQGALGASLDEAGWISTAYLIAEIVVIPLTGWLARVFSLRRYLIANALLFLAFSVACGFARSLPQMIALRAAQGLTGGVLIPLAFTVILTSLPQAQQPVGLALFSLSATFAPAIGPTIGGYLTAHWSWQYVFYVNAIPGALMVTLLWLSLEREPPRLDLLRQGDWAGAATLALGLGALQTVLEEGNRDDWFGSPFIVRLALLSALALGLFLWVELRRAEPLLPLRLLLRRSFGLGALANFLLGAALYGSVFAVPLYLGRVQGYGPEQIGRVLAWTGLPQLLVIPWVPRLMRRFDPRVLIATGFALFATSCFLNSGLSADYAGDQLLLPNAVRALGQALILTPLAAVVTGSIEPANAGAASALFNMLRNLGGAVGIAGLATALTRREQYHSNLLAASVSNFGEATRARLAELAPYLAARGAPTPVAARREALVALGRGLREQAYVMAFGDIFFLLGLGLLLALAAALLLPRPAQLRAGTGH